MKCEHKTENDKPIINIIFVDGHSGDEIAKSSFYTVEAARRYIYLILNDPESIFGVGEIRIELTPAVYETLRRERLGE
jgi:hypothetical protein